MHSRHEDPGEPITEDLGDLDQETLRELAEEHGLDMPEWRPNVDQTLNADPEELARFQELHDHALAEMEAAQADPTQQTYFKRLDTKAIVQSEAEYKWCIQNFVPLKLVSYDSAVDAMNKADAKLRAKRARRKANKRARASRKANRKHA